MTTLFWALEYGKVHIAYMIMMFVWPSLLFKKYLKGKSLTFRFGFCTTVSVLLINTFVLIMGLVGILKPWLIRVLFYGSILVSLYFGTHGKKNALKQAGRVLMGTYGFKQLLLTLWLAVFGRIKQAAGMFYEKVKNRKGEFILLSIVLLYGMIYFTYGAFQMYSYGSGDMYPHNAWIYGLTQGEVFSAGVYPEGMHCFIYAMYVLFGIRIYSCMLFTAGVHVLTFLLGGYCLFREVFRSRYTPILVLALFLTLDVRSPHEVYSMARLQWTIPQEFAFFTLFLCGTFLSKYLKAPGRQIAWLERRQHPFWEPIKRWKFNDELLIFMMALATSLTIHFYPTIMAFFLCLAFVPLAIHKIVRPSRFLPLTAAVIAGFTIAVLPMGLALASGIPFQGSIDWAVNVINGTEREELDGVTVEEEDEEMLPGDDTSLSDGGEAEEGEPRGAEDSSDTGNGQTGTAREKSSAVRTAAEHVAGFFLGLRDKAETVYMDSYVMLYQLERGTRLIKMTILALILFLICKIGNLLYIAFTKNKEVRADLFDGYLALTLASFCYMTMYAANSLGLPELIAGARLCSVSHLLIMGVCMIPADLVLWGLGKINTAKTMTKLSYVLVTLIYLGTMVYGCFHGYLYYELTRYNGAVMVTDAIVRNVPQNHYTIVSTVDELYQIIQYGYHEEAIQFINYCVDNDYVLPTEYVFVYVEKRPLEYAQIHFASGPKWLAWQKYPVYYNTKVSVGDRINSGAISPELSEAPFYQYPISSKAYSDLGSRVVVESRLQGWCEEFDRLYPNELHVYYEDEDFICYYFKQNPACLYQLGIQ